jgi:hypothetical protein
LFAASFETLSEPGGHFLGTSHSQDPFPLSLSPIPHIPHHHHCHQQPREIDITLPELRHVGSFEDVSPIKISHCLDDTHHRSHSTSHIMSQPSAHWWRPDPARESRGGYADSNPFYVMRSACRAFAHCRYLLPCLQGMDMCPVHMSEYGHIRHFRGPENVGTFNLCHAQ